jgi:putative Holliday junction resolvase
MRILALDHGTKRIGVAVSDEMKMIAQPLEYIPAEPFAAFLERLKHLLREKEVELSCRHAAHMDGSYGPAALKVQEFVAALKAAVNRAHQDLGRAPDLGMANRFLLQGNVRRDQRKEKVDKMAQPSCLQSYLDSLAA